MNSLYVCVRILPASGVFCVFSFFCVCVCVGGGGGGGHVNSAPGHVNSNRRVNSNFINIIIIFYCFSVFSKISGIQTDPICVKYTLKYFFIVSRSFHSTAYIGNIAFLCFATLFVKLWMMYFALCQNLLKLSWRLWIIIYTFSLYPFIWHYLTLTNENP